MAHRKWLFVSGTLLLLAALVAVAWSAPRVQTGATLRTPTPSLNLPDILTSDLSSTVEVFDAEVWVVAAGATKDFDGCVAVVRPQGQTQFVWVITPDHHLQSVIELAVARNKMVRIAGRKYTDPPDFEAWLGMDVYLAVQVDAPVKSL